MNWHHMVTLVSLAAKWSPAPVDVINTSPLIMLCYWPTASSTLQIALQPQHKKPLELMYYCWGIGEYSSFIHTTTTNTTTTTTTTTTQILLQRLGRLLDGIYQLYIPICGRRPPQRCRNISIKNQRYYYWAGCWLVYINFIYQFAAEGRRSE